MKNRLYGAMIGDISGSRYEFSPNKHKTGYPVLDTGCRFTDDTVMTIAVASALMMHKENGIPFDTAVISEMQRLGRQYPHAGYGGSFYRWLMTENPLPYGSWGNGSAMRVSPCGFAATSLEEALELAKISASVTHNHPAGIAGAQATAACIYLCRTGAEKADIRAYVEREFYRLDQTLDEIRPHYHFDVSCFGSVPQAIECFLESESYTDTIRNAISLGGDCDTMGAIGGAIAWAYYCRTAEPDNSLTEEAAQFLPPEFRRISDRFDIFCENR